MTIDYYLESGRKLLLSALIALKQSQKFSLLTIELGEAGKLGKMYYFSVKGETKGRKTSSLIMAFLLLIIEKQKIQSR